MITQNKKKLDLIHKDRKLTATMIEDFIYNPILAAKVILNIKVPPHEELRLMWMWTHYYTSDDSGFSTGKTFTHSVISALRCILFPGRTVGILSKTYAQGKLIFSNFDKWYDLNPIFKWCVKHKGGKAQLIHGSDAHRAIFNGGSEARVLPPNFMQDAERIRSERWNDGHFDEWTTFHNFTAFNKTIIGRVTKENQYPDCPVRQNHIHLSSTPNFIHHPSYKQVARIQRLIDAGDRDHSRFSCNYRHIPDTKEHRWLVNRKVIFTMQTTLPKGIRRTEVDGVWEKDSLSYYSVNVPRYSYKVYSVNFSKKPVMLYSAGYDVARGKSKDSSSDDFALSVFEFNSNFNEPPRLMLTVRKNNITSEGMAGIIHAFHIIFGFSIITYDPGGGGLFVKDELRKDIIPIDGKVSRVYPILEIDDVSGTIGDHILIPMKRGHVYSDQRWGKMRSDSIFVNTIHREFKSAIENGNVHFPEAWTGWENEGSDWDIGAKRAWLNRNASLSIEQKNRAEMDLALSQLILVDVERNHDTNEPLLDSFGMYKFGSKGKKDSAYSLLYSYTGYDLLKNRLAGETGDGSGFAASFG